MIGDDLTPARMKRLRERLGFKKGGDFAKYLGFSKQRWFNVETGHPVSREIAQRLKQAIPGIDYDWIWDGETDGLSDEAASMLGVTKQPKTKKTNSSNVPEPLANLLRTALKKK